MENCWAVALVFILLVLSAYVTFFHITSCTAARGGAIVGGAIVGGADATFYGKPHHHPLGDALGSFARGLDLERERVGGGVGGGAATGGHAGAKKHWTEFETYADLIGNGGKQLSEYENTHFNALNNPDFDWAPVLAKVNPLLADNHEYIGIVNVEADGRTLRLDGLEASPVKSGTVKDGLTFASVPAAMVEKWARRPALFLFHTHPADPRGNPLPSTPDISTSIYFSSINWAINVVISRFGVFAYSVDREGLKSIHGSKNFPLAVANFSHDVVAAHQSVRSWSPHTMADQLEFFRRYRMYCYMWPTSEVVSALGNPGLVTYDLLSPIDHEIIEMHRDIGRRAMRQRAAPSRQIPHKFRQQALGFD